MHRNDWLQGWARRFWESTEGSERLPKDIARASLYALPVGIFYLPALRLRDVGAWLQRRGLNLHPSGPDRPLRGCLVAYKGHGLLLVDGLDSAEEQRFTIAHEIAHFMLDYWRPRERALRRLGPDALEVLDGSRSPSVGERVDALLADVPLAVHTHLLDRAPDGSLVCGATIRSECQADMLALELLAPASEVVTRLQRVSGLPFAKLVDQAVIYLVEEFGLPQKIADAYARQVVLEWTGGPSVREWFGIR